MGQLGSADGRLPIYGVVQRLQDAIWGLGDESQSHSVLGELQRGLDELDLHASAALVHLVEERRGVPAVKFTDLLSRDGWRWTCHAAEQEPVISLWRLGGGVRGGTPADTLIPGTMDAAAQRCQLRVRSALEVPFSHGVFGLYSDQPDAFGAAANLCMEHLGLVLSVMYHRVADLRALGTKESQLRHMQRLQLAGQLAAEVAHDLGGPLTVLMGECELLMESELDPEVAEAVEAIGHAGQQVHSVVNRLLDFVRGHRPDKEWVNCNRLVQETIELVRRGFAKDGIALEEDLGRNLPWIQAHAGQVRQVVLNLLQNAREAIAGNRKQGRVQVRTYVCDGHVVLEVEDNGPGVSPEIADRIFEPFFTTKQDASGTGLGLSVCAGIASEHGGELRLEPRLMGACIRLELPVKQATDIGVN
jgi:signal transduction histidine kinase